MVNPFAQFPYTALGTGGLGATAGGVFRLAGALSEAAQAGTTTEYLVSAGELSGALLEGAALGGSVGLGIGAVAGVLIAGGIYAYEVYYH